MVNLKFCSVGFCHVQAGLCEYASLENIKSPPLKGISIDFCVHTHFPAHTPVPLGVRLVSAQSGCLS